MGTQVSKSENNLFAKTLVQMGTQISNSDTVPCRGKIEIIYSSTSGTSKHAASHLQSVLQHQKYYAPITNIGDYDIDELSSVQVPVIFLLSTYGDGASPSDGDTFYDWISKHKPSDGQFKKLRYSILAFGNSSFEKHCGFGLCAEKYLKLGGGSQYIELTMCDAKNKDKNYESIFPVWSKSLISLLNNSHKIKLVPRWSICTSYYATLLHQPNYKWEQESHKVKNIGKQFSNYLNMAKVKVIHIKQLRKKDDGRSTLAIRLQIDKDIQLWPACNIDVFPQNKDEFKQDDDLLISFSQSRGKVPFPKMPLRQIHKLIDIHQKASDKMIKSAILLSTNEEVRQSYTKRLQQKLEIDVTCKKLMVDLQPKPQFLPEVGLNNVRTYTLASWDSNHQHLDICVSLVKHGLTSNYFKRQPQFLRIKANPSSFYIPEGRPIVLVANGSGIAPFRSIVQYIANLPVEKRPYIRLYFGIQNADIDYYFQEEWKQFEKNKIVDIRLAESRKGSSKEYVQNIMEKDVPWLTEHLCINNGVLFVCGGQSMSKEVGNVVFKALSIHTVVPYKAFSLLSKLRQQKTIVEQVFG